MKSLEVIQVIRTTLLHRGAGVVGDPYRVVEQYWSMEGKLLWEVDPFNGEGVEVPGHGLTALMFQGKPVMHGPDTEAVPLIPKINELAKKKRKKPRLNLTPEQKKERSKEYQRKYQAKKRAERKDRQLPTGESVMNGERAVPSFLNKFACVDCGHEMETIQNTVEVCEKCEGTSVARVTI